MTLSCGAMNQEYKNLQSLVDLAREESSDRRRELLREVTDLFLDAPASLSDGEVEHFSTIMGKVAYDLEMKVRQELAERLAGVDGAPRDLINRLANDDIEVARPVLMQSGVLRNADLVDIVQARSQDHLLAVSKRETVAEEVADALVARGDDTVLESLAGNRGAEISRRAMETLVTRSEEVEALHQPLAHRGDVPPDLMHEMFFWVSSALRQHILEATADIDEATLDQILDETRQDLERDAQDDDFRWTAPRQFIDQEVARGRLVPSLIVELLRNKKEPECIVAFGRLADVDESTASRIIFQGGPEGLAVACKAAGFDRNAFSNMMLLTAKGGVHKAGAKFELLDLYDKVTEQTAKRTLRFWRTRRQASRSAVTQGAG